MMIPKSISDMYIYLSEGVTQASRARSDTTLLVGYIIHLLTTKDNWFVLLKLNDGLSEWKFIKKISDTCPEVRIHVNPVFETEMKWCEPVVETEMMLTMSNRLHSWP